jgi:chromosome segregation ATPase
MFVIVIMVLVMGFGGYVLFQVQNKLDEANAQLKQSGESIDELESRLAATGSDVSKTFEAMQEQSNTNVSEIDKLWAVAYRQNRPKIDRVALDLENAITRFRGELDPIAGAVSGIGGQFDDLNKEMIGLKQIVTMDNEDRATELALIGQQLQDQADIVETLRRELGVLNERLDDARQDIRSNLEYRARHNSEVLEMKKQIQRLEEPAPSPSISVNPSPTD